jgi:hypothetical protein
MSLNFKKDAAQIISGYIEKIWQDFKNRNI